MLLKTVHISAATTPVEMCTTEAHGTGTGLGDPIEAKSLHDSVMAERQNMNAFALALGSLKANAGHSEGAAGLYICSCCICMVRVLPVHLLILYLHGQCHAHFCPPWLPLSCNCHPPSTHKTINETSKQNVQWQQRYRQRKKSCESMGVVNQYPSIVQRISSPSKP